MLNTTFTKYNKQVLQLMLMRLFLTLRDNPDLPNCEPGKKIVEKTLEISDSSRKRPGDPHKHKERMGSSRNQWEPKKLKEQT